MAEGIVYVDKMPVVAIDAEGVTLVACSGDKAWRRRFARSTWRDFLEREIVRLHEHEMAERADRGRVLSFAKAK